MIRARSDSPRSTTIPWLALLAAACGSAPGASPPTPHAPCQPPSVLALPAASASSAPSTPPSTTAGRYLPVFDALAARVADWHQFPVGFEAHVGHAHRVEVERLRREAERAADRAAFVRVARRLSNSLHDAHCRYVPPSDLGGPSRTLGFEVWAGGSLAEPELRVAQPTTGLPAPPVAVGERIVAIDGRTTSQWFAEHANDAIALHSRQRLAELGRFLTSASPWMREEGTAPVVLTLTSEDGTTREQTLPWLDPDDAPEPKGIALDDPPPMAEVGCEVTRPIAYDGYRLAAHGSNLCVYRPEKGRPNVPIVRWLSFLYESRSGPTGRLRAIRAEHDLLRRELAGAEGVILDVHENSGGLNPYLFASWFAQAPTTHPKLVTRVVPELTRAQVSSMFFGGDTRGYEAAQQRGDRVFESFFLCPHGRCEVDPPAASELVTKAPVALLVGPECHSTCDTLAFLWSNERLGPVVGRVPAASYTVYRHKVRVGELAAKAGLPSEDLGTFTFAMSASYVRGKPLEGEPIALDWTAPDTFDTRASWVSASAREAVRLLRAGKRSGSDQRVK